MKRLLLFAIWHFFRWLEDAVLDVYLLLVLSQNPQTLGVKLEVYRQYNAWSLIKPRLNKQLLSKILGTIGES